MGKTLGEATRDRWFLDTPVPGRWADTKLVGIDKKVLESNGVQIVQAGMPGSKGPELDFKHAELGFAVITESPALRFDADVPLIVPEVNADHLQLIKAQQSARGFDRGFVVASPLCTATIAALAIKPLADAFGVEKVICTTMQALSGAGPTGVPSLRVVDNVMPFIPDEEEKLEGEFAKIFGRFDGDQISSYTAPMAATCTRVAVRDGHTYSMTLGLEKSASIDEVSSAFSSFSGPAQELSLPSAPSKPLLVHSDSFRPQPILDRDLGKGRIVSIGRIRENKVFKNGISYVALGDNHRRGTVGNSIIVCELIAAQEFINE